jgi:hypothetical protein
LSEEQKREKEVNSVLDEVREGTVKYETLSPSQRSIVDNYY